MDAVISAGDLDAADLDLIGEFEKYGIVAGVTDRDVSDRNVFRVAEKYCMGAPNPLFAFRIRWVVAVDDALAGDRDVFDTVTENQRPMTSQVGADKRNAFLAA